ncbi:MAG TPA: AAA family ATPase, partial [Tenericutes bacterium]|nr:AAA family ATPase [Mycoplasmatota bacterium]
INIIEHNIYKVIDEVDEISFLKVDEIARKMNIDENDIRRIKACILYIFKDITFKNGDTYLEYIDLYKNTCSYFKYNINEEDFFNYLKELVDEEKIVFDNNKYYLKQIWEDENIIVEKINILIKKEKTNYKDIEKNIKDLEKENNIIYNDLQKEAIVSSLENNIQIITGGPGTGKTTIIKAIVELYKYLNNLDYEELIKEVSLLAPTGRAAKRISESTNMPANTIHRFLKWNKETNQFGVNEYNKDHSKLFIIDEVSMIDICLLSSLFKGINNNIKIILVGDYNQLPSVGPGQILKDLIDSNIVSTVHLNYLYRQDENSYITTLAHEIKNNSLNESFLESKSDYTFLKCSSNTIKNNLSNICEQIISKGYDYKRVQIMAPMYAGINGIDNLNKELQKVFNPHNKDKKELKYEDVIFRENDKILQLVNIPEENVYNGDLGIIKKIYTSDISTSGKNEIHVDFDGNLVKYMPKDFGKIKHGYIISIHKSQGSEFEVVVIPISLTYKRMLYRKLIYTAITRAKRKLILLGEPDSFIYSVQNNNEYTRKTNLLRKLNNDV